MPLGPFAARLRHLRRRHNLTQLELAHRLGLARHGYISNLEASRKSPSLELVVRIASLFGVTTDYLLRDKNFEEGISSPISLKLFKQSPLPRLFGTKLRQLRHQHGLLQAEAAQKLGLAKRGYISNLETGRKEPSLELVVRIADLFGVTTDYLLRDDVPIEALATSGNDTVSQS